MYQTDAGLQRGNKESPLCDESNLISLKTNTSLSTHSIHRRPEFHGNLNYVSNSVNVMFTKYAQFTAQENKGRVML